MSNAAAATGSVQTAMPEAKRTRLLYDAENRVETARLYGDVVSYQYYYIDLLVGTPVPQRTSVIADTGSTICAFTCSGCQSCGHHLDANFDFSKSSTAQWLPCGQGCDSCKNRRCSYRQSYTEGSSIEGSKFTDFVSLGDEFQQNPPVKVHMGCHTLETRLFVTQKANGIMGLAPGRRGAPTVLEEMFQDRTHVNAATFAMCLARQGGLLTVGGFNESLNLEEVRWIPMRVERFYGVSLSKIQVEGGEAITGGFGHTFVDSGTTYTYLPDQIYRRLKDSVKSACKNGACGQEAGSQCWRMTGSVSSFPKLLLTLSDTVVSWGPSSYLYSRTSNMHCLGFESNGGVQETVLGATFMIDQHLVFDTQGKRLGLAAAACPSFTERPPGPTRPFAPGMPPPLAGVPGQTGQLQDVQSGALFIGVCMLLVAVALCLVGRNLLRAFATTPEANGPTSPASRRARARKLGRASPVEDEEMQSLAASPSEEVTRVPLDTWLGDATLSDSPTPGSGSEL
ncbi:unnamed protein product [Effrenium voratum]|nr:unnamed protein product [Effrenium voratum]